MIERTEGQGQAQPNRLFGQDFMAWLRQGLAELREVFNPSRESIAQPVQYGAIGQPPPSTVARALSNHDQAQGYSLDQLKERGREIIRDQDHEQHRDHGNDRGR